jgi:hypothetical protein
MATTEAKMDGAAAAQAAAGLDPQANEGEIGRIDEAISSLAEMVIDTTVMAKLALFSMRFDQCLEHLAQTRMALEQLEGIARRIRGNVPPWEREPLIIPAASMEGLREGRRA